ncbi:DNA repair protein RecN [Bifidobacterium eulemuris]|uniref:DNA repair protein RecN n=1 Tax=Bifidobacterium eulemuris TaxID=1765219 RepID=A0A261GBY8_9BIFI|nr:DNA repair protein RecN [Bifidobacterium eulemuris]OZG68924.1 DNA repair protein RecN [Bifidobacterium eulemuris]QOL31538.1 DNA repair protein RecN [Bifidobacterium eulemuris]
MLDELDIRNLGPIREATIAPAQGMTAITGETGAGKSMLLSAIRLISGDAGEAGRVAAGASEAWAQGVFTVSDGAPAAEIAREAGVEPEDGELFLTRTLPASGRSRAVLSGRSVPRSVLSALAGELVTIHGQADQLRIASAAKQREFLDRYAGDERELGEYRAAWDALRRMDERLLALTSQEASARQQADYLRESIERINRIDPRPGEDMELRARRERIENAAEIASGVGRALSALDSSQMGVDADGISAIDLINQAIQSLRSIRVDGVFAEQADRLDAIVNDLSDVVFTLARELDVEGDVEDLDVLNARIHELGELTRRWGPELSDVIAWRDKAVFDVEDLDASPEKIAELEAERGRLYAAALDAAAALSEARAAAAAELAERVTSELDALAMPGARLDITVTPRGSAAGDTGADGSRDASARSRSRARRVSVDGRRGKLPVDSDAGLLDAHGWDDIAFLFTPFPGSPQLPMGKSASGGELSRLMLALELSAADKRAARRAGGRNDGTAGDVGGAGVSGDMTFIFDEVDAGVGGKAAVELGRRLARLARSAQVIVVTHLPQVASWADAQFVVSKGVGSDETVSTTVGEVCDEARVREIARMLSGSESDASLDHARELLVQSTLV